jgi:hypothetical protein
MRGCNKPSSAQIWFLVLLTILTSNRTGKKEIGEMFMCVNSQGFLKICDVRASYIIACCCGKFKNLGFCAAAIT